MLQVKFLQFIQSGQLRAARAASRVLQTSTAGQQADFYSVLSTAATGAATSVDDASIFPSCVADGDSCVAPLPAAAIRVRDD
jgi:hypothetical protein